MKTIILLSLFFTLPAQAENSLQETHNKYGMFVHCHADASDGENWITLIEFVDTVSLGRIEEERTAKEKAQTDSCDPRPNRTKKYGNPQSLQLQVAAWKCGTYPPYYSMEIFWQGLPIMTYMNDNKGHLQGDFTLNDQAMDRDLPALQMPEGKFNFVNITCAEITPFEAISRRADLALKAIQQKH